MKLRSRFFIILFLSALFLAGCSGSQKPQGVYYPALSHTFLKQKLSSDDMAAGNCYSTDSFRLYYNGEVYTLSHSYQEYSKSSLPLDTLPGAELCTVYGNGRVHWADNEEDLAACTHTGTLYRVTGYDEDFRVCLYYEEPARVDMGQGPVYHLYIFDRTNNITLHTGRDYYSRLYHFPTDATLNHLNMADETVSSFVDALLTAEFIDPSEEDLPEFTFDTDTTYFFSFTDALGLSNSVAIYEDGYVVDAENHNFILKLDPALCKSLIDSLHKPEWPGDYKYVTYSYDKESGIRTEYKYELGITETETRYLLDLCVTQTEVHLNPSGTPIDSTVTVGPADTFSIAKEEANNAHLLSFVSQKVPDRPDLITYVELKKGLQDDIISLRYADSEKELENNPYIILNKQ